MPTLPLLAALLAATPAAHAGDLQLDGDTLLIDAPEVLFVLDRSCSMHDGDAFAARSGLTRLDAAQQVLSRTFDALVAEGTAFDLVTLGPDVDGDYAFDSAFGGLTVPGQKTLLAAQGWLAGLEGGGATVTGPALAWVLANHPEVPIVLVTDGAPNCGAASDADASVLDLAPYLRGLSTSAAATRDNAAGCLAGGWSRSDTDDLCEVVEAHGTADTVIHTVLINPDAADEGFGVARACQQKVKGSIVQIN